MKILNFGSLNYDYVYSVDHILRPGETLASSKRETFCGGKGLNQSIALARAGAKVFHGGLVGEDGRLLLDTCTDNGVDVKYISMIQGESGHTIIQVDKDAQNCILLHAGSNKKFTKEYIDQVLSNFTKGDFILLQNEVNELAYIIEKAYEKEMIIALNPSPFDKELLTCGLEKVSVFLLNEIEGEEITSKSHSESIMEKMLETYPDSRVVLTLGMDGALYGDRQQRVKQEIFKVKAVDTTAAGDTFTGFFLASLFSQKPVKEALEIAAKASAIAVSREGATSSIPTIDEVEKFST